MKNIIATIIADGRFTYLANALTAAGMLDTLGGSGPFTLFAPVDAAFDQWPTELFQRLLKRPARASLTTLMTFHAVAGKSQKSDFKDGQLLPTINSEPVLIRINDDHFCINDVNVIEGIEAANGFIYVIDALLIPNKADGLLTELT